MSQFVQVGKKTALAFALASGATVPAAAQQCEVSTKSIYRLLAQSGFRRRVANMRAQLYTEALGRMTSNLTRAADALAALLDEKEPGVRLRAARALLTLSARLEDTVSTGDRVRELEQQFETQQQELP